MKFSVNDSCIGCGLCANTCPEVFHMDDGHAVAAPGSVSPALEPSARDAMESCPVNAIESV